MRVIASSTFYNIIIHPGCFITLTCIPYLDPKIPNLDDMEYWANMAVITGVTARMVGLRGGTATGSLSLSTIQPTLPLDIGVCYNTCMCLVYYAKS